MWAPDGSSWQRAYLAFEWSAIDSPPQDAGLVCGACADSSPEDQAGVAVGNANGPSAAVAAELRVPTSAELPQHLANIIQVHGAVEVLAQLLKVCPREQLQDACRHVWATMRPDERFTMVRSMHTHVTHATASR